MKVNRILLRAVFILTAIFVFLFGAKAEIFIGSSTNVNSMVVASNEVILISAIRGTAAGINYSVLINLNGTIQTIIFSDYDLFGRKYVLAGPAILSFPASSGTNSFPICVCFQRIQGTSIQSVFASTNITATIQVPAGKTCHFFAPFPLIPASPQRFSVQAVSGVVSNLSFYGDEEFSGPATITFGGSYLNYWEPIVISYYQTDDSLNLPSGVLQGPTGSFVITVEESTDLTNWSPVMIQATGSDLAAFYRLSFSH